MLWVAVCLELYVPPLRLACLLSVSPFIFSLRSFLSLRLSRVSGAIVCLRLVYEEHWFTREVWLARTRSVRRGGAGGNMNEFTPVLYFYPFIPKFSHQRSSCLHADTSSLTFPLRARQWVCVCTEPDGQPTLARGSFLWPGQCVSRRLAGVSGASSSFQLHSLTPGPLQRAFATQPLLSHFEILQHTNSTWFPTFIKSDRLRLWDLLRRRGWGGGGGGVKYSKTGKNIESGFHGSAGNGKSWTKM